MTIFSKFIGGTSIPQVLTTAKKVTSKGYIPIFDYAKEGSKNVNEVVNYVREINKLIDKNTDITSNYAYAAKLSSFTPYNPKDTLLHVVNRISDKHEYTNTPYVFLDSEQPHMKDIEDDVFNYILNKTISQNVLIFKTYQMYRKDSLSAIKEDIERFDKLGLKIVRGAYYDGNNPVFWKTKEETDECYNEAIEILSKTNKHVCFATHNDESIKKAISMNINKSNKSFGQLLGMRDDLSDMLVGKGYKVFKYVPYGNMKELYPYLLRRLYENKDILRHIFYGKR